MIEYVKDKEGFIPGIELLLTYGHTTGMMHPLIRDSENTIFYAADIFPMASHVPLAWVMAYDLNPVQTIKEKRSLLPKMVDENWTIFFEHDPVRQAGKVTIDGKNYRLKESVIISD